MQISTSVDEMKITTRMIHCYGLANFIKKKDDRKASDGKGWHFFQIACKESITFGAIGLSIGTAGSLARTT